MTEVLTYEALKAERDALADRVNALAVENAALKNQEPKAWYIQICGGSVTTDPDEARMWLGVPLVRTDIETPATDAALAAIRKESHIAGIQAAADRIGVISLKYKPGQKQELIKAIGREVFQYATELREAK